MQESDFKLLKVGTGGYAVRQMQTVLQELGFYDGPISGNFSRDFEQAVKDFQKDFNVEVTGKIDYELYSLLYEEFSSFPQETAQPKATQKPKPTSKPTEKPKEEKKDDFWSLLFGSDEDEEIQVEKNGTYTDKDHVAAYLKEYGELPSNYITKNEHNVILAKLYLLEQSGKIGITAVNVRNNVSHNISSLFNTGKGRIVKYIDLNFGIRRAHYLGKSFTNGIFGVIMPCLNKGDTKPLGISPSVMLELAANDGISTKSGGGSDKIRSCAARNCYAGELFFGKI